MRAVGSISASTPPATLRYLLVVPWSIPKKAPSSPSVLASFMWIRYNSRACRMYNLERVPGSDDRRSSSQKRRSRVPLGHPLGELGADIVELHRIQQGRRVQFLGGSYDVVQEGQYEDLDGLVGGRTSGFWSSGAVIEYLSDAAASPIRDMSRFLTGSCPSRDPVGHAGPAALRSSP